VRYGLRQIGTLSGVSVMSVETIYIRTAELSNVFPRRRRDTRSTTRSAFHVELTVTLASNTTSSAVIGQVSATYTTSEGSDSASTSVDTQLLVSKTISPACFE